MCSTDTAHMTDRALLINADYQPIRLISWEKAVTLIYESKAELIENYAGRVVRSVSLLFDLPAVIRLIRYKKVKSRIRFNRYNVLARDNYTCAYCGLRPWKDKYPNYDLLTLDHIVPRSKGGKTTWLNIVTACVACNRMKADKSVKDASLALRYEARVPNSMDILRMSIIRYPMQKEWVSYLPPQAQNWSSYWTVELEP
jgi:5-methylcytosine-specific restriction endonuclease McrA